MLFPKNIQKIFILVLLFLPLPSLAANIHSGKIYLQVEKNGEAWYIYPVNNQRYFLGKPNDAFNIMRTLGLGVSNKNLAQIPIGILGTNELDSDSDGLPDNLETIIGTNILNPDSDGDDYSDKAELDNGTDPLGAGKWGKNNSLVNSLKGRILLQVEKKGEAWYLNPKDLKRYYLGRPSDAFLVMRSLGIGISNSNLAKINSSFVKTKHKVNDYYEITIPGSWEKIETTEVENYYFDFPVKHYLKLTEPTQAAILEIKIIDSADKDYTLNDFLIEYSKYATIKSTEDFIFDIKPARKQIFKYNSDVEIEKIKYHKGEKILVVIMLSTKNFVQIEYQIPDTENIAAFEKIFNDIYASLKLKY